MQNQRKSLFYANHKSYKRAGNAVLQPHLSLALSFSPALICYISFPLFEWLYHREIRAARQRAMSSVGKQLANSLRQRERLPERDPMLRGRQGCSRTTEALAIHISRSVSVLCPVPLPSFAAFHLALPRPAKHVGRPAGFCAFTSNVYLAVLAIRRPPPIFPIRFRTLR